MVIFLCLLVKKREMLRFKDAERPLNKQELNEVLNTLNTIILLDEQITRLSHTTFYCKEVKMFANQLAKQLNKEIEKRFGDTINMFGEELYQLTDIKLEFIVESQKIPPEQWQFIAGASKIISQKEKYPIAFAQLQSIILQNIKD